MSYLMLIKRKFNCFKKLTNEKINVIIFLLIISKVLLNGATTTIDSFCSFYNYKINRVSEKIKDINNFGKPLWYYTGLDTGYGFFAPNVSSNFIVILKTEKKNYINTEILDTKEGKLKFLTINSIFLDNVKNGFNPIDKEKIKYNHIVLKQINNFYKRKYKNESFKTKVFLYDHPKLKEFHKQINLLPIDSIR